MAGRLKDKVAFITGGCSGMGLGTVELFAEEGARVLVGDIQDEKGAALEERFDGSVLYTHCDVTVEAQIKAAVGLAAERFGGLDIVFNNAGATVGRPPVEEITIESWDRGMALLLRSTFLSTKYAVPLLKARGGGAIVNNSSGTALGSFSSPNALAYGAAKAGVLQLSRLLASDLAKHHIRVNVIVPGYIKTSIIAQKITDDIAIADRMADLMEPKYRTLQPIPEVGMPRDIAEAVLFLASDAARWITGVVLPIDGGLLVKFQNEHDPWPIAQALEEAYAAVLAERAED